jgi:small nuclear ribonucleoprotein (snRNP)-like protein
MDSVVKHAPIKMIDLGQIRRIRRIRRIRLKLNRDRMMHATLHIVQEYLNMTILAVYSETILSLELSLIGKRY